MNPAADAVRHERLRRGWSVRTAAAATHGKLSNTWWGNFEDYRQPLTANIVEAVAEAFGWDTNWPATKVARPAGGIGKGLGSLIVSDPVAHTTRSDLDELTDRVTRLEAALHDLAVQTRRLAGELDADEMPSDDAIPGDQALGADPQ